MRVFKTILFSSLIAISANAAADVWAEREALSNIQTELAALEALVMNARARSNASHLTVPMEPVVPSTIDALSVNYTEHKQ